MPGFRAVALRIALATCLLLAGLVPPATASPGQQEMVRAINAARAQHGLRPYRLAPSLARSSRAFAGHLMRTDVFGHAATIQASRRFRMLGEALAMHTGSRPRRRGTVSRWLNSPGHRALVLSRAYTRVGAGRAVGRFGGYGRATIWVAQFGRY